MGRNQRMEETRVQMGMLIRKVGSSSTRRTALRWLFNAASGVRAYLFVAFCPALNTLMAASVMVKLFSRRLSPELEVDEEEEEGGGGSDGEKENEDKDEEAEAPRVERVAEDDEDGDADTKKRKTDEDDWTVKQEKLNFRPP